jgi:hypothetical protein
MSSMYLRADSGQILSCMNEISLFNTKFPVVVPES